MAYLLASFIGGLGPTLIVSRLLYLLCRQWAFELHPVGINLLSFLVVCPLAAYGSADGGPLNWVSGSLYLLPQLVWTVVDLVRISAGNGPLFLRKETDDVSDSESQSRSSEAKQHLNEIRLYEDLKKTEVSTGIPESLEKPEDAVRVHERLKKVGDTIKIYKGFSIIRGQGYVSVNGERHQNVLKAEAWIDQLANKMADGANADANGPLSKDSLDVDRNDDSDDKVDSEKMLEKKAVQPLASFEANMSSDTHSQLLSADSLVSEAIKLHRKGKLSDEALLEFIKANA